MSTSSQIKRLTKAQAQRLLESAMTALGYCAWSMAGRIEARWQERQMKRRIAKVIRTQAAKKLCLTQ
jgi:hypothetical protein